MAQHPLPVVPPPPQPQPPHPARPSRPPPPARATDIIMASDPSIDLECPVCLLDITVTTRAVMDRCPHAFHRSCIAEWHATQRRNNHAPDCPICRTPGAVATPTWPVYTFTRSLCGPWGSVAVTPDLLVVNARYWFSQPTKQLIRYSDVAKYYRNHNTIFLVDSVGAILTSFSVRRPQELFEALATASVKYYERYHERTVRRPMHRVIAPTPR
jgi:hypothetical protein